MTIFDIARYRVPRRNFLPRLAIFGLMIVLAGCPSPTPPAVEVPQITAAATIAPLTLGTALPEDGIVIATKSGGGDIASCEVASDSTNQLPQGIMLSSNADGNCILTGTPTRAENTTYPKTYTLSIVATNSGGRSEAVAVSLNVNSFALTLSASQNNMPITVAGAEQTITLTATAPNGSTYAWKQQIGSSSETTLSDTTATITPALPAQSSLSADTPVTFTVTVTHMGNTAVATITIQVQVLGTLSLSLADGNFTSAQTLQITYTPVGSETADSILYTFTTDGTEPADPSLPASNPTSYTLGTDIAILATADSRYRIRAIARRGSSTSADITGTFTRFPANDIDGDGVLNDMDIDDDNDGLIEITGATMAARLTMLHNMRYNLAGTSYDDEEADTSPGDAGSTLGAPTTATANCSTGTDVDGDANTALTFLCGYELTGNLTFDTGSNGTWSNTGTADAPVYSLDSADSASPYFVTASGGWLPIGTANSDGNRFTAIFEGNGHSITGLAVQRDLGFVGMFGVMGAGAEIRNLGLVNVLADYSGSSGAIYVGGLVGRQQAGQVTASYSTGSADGGAGDQDYVGGLIGRQQAGQVTASYSTGSADGGAGDRDYVGGLVGWQAGGQVTASYSTGSADGGDGGSDYVGGLVGRQQAGQVTASYSSASADGGAGSQDYVGGLVGWQQAGQVTASYSTVSADGGSGGQDSVGGLIGYQNGGQVTASYSTGSADGGAGDTDAVGGLIGYQNGGSVVGSYSAGNANGGADAGDVAGSFIGFRPNAVTNSFTASYGFGTATAETTSGAVTIGTTAGTAGIAGTDKPTGVTTPAGLTAANAGTEWNAAASSTAGAWDFDTKTRAELGGGPSLRYADYDGTDSTTGNAYYCSGQTKPTTGTPIEIPNCGMLIPGQQ